VKFLIKIDDILKEIMKSNWNKGNKW
jgi:hypothetical protein